LPFVIALPLLALKRAVAYIRSMTAVEIIDEIKRLPRAEQNRVIDFVRKAGEAHPLTPDELGELAKKMVEAKDPAEADRLQAEFVRGFYGEQLDGALPPGPSVAPQPFLRLTTVGGEGVRPEVDLNNSAALLAFLEQGG
jgi:hypothetical protein